MGNFFEPRESTVIDAVTRAIDLEEGKEGVKKVLWAIYLHPRESLKTISQVVYLPMPLIKEICKELRNHNLIYFETYCELTAIGKALVEQQLGFEKIQSARCPVCKGKSIIITSKQEQLLEKLTNIAAEYQRTEFNMKLNQAPCLLETSLRRALYLQQQGHLGRRILCVGDSDLSSIAMTVVSPQTRVGVVDIDQQLIDSLNTIKSKYNLNLVARCYDLRKNLPEEFSGVFDAFVTDPPYTSAGFKLFVSRGIQGLEDPFSGKYGYISYSIKPVSEMLIIQKMLGEMGLVLRDLIPNFNEYYAANIIGGQSQFLVVEASKITKSLVNPKEEYYKQIYTNSFRRSKTNLRPLSFFITEEGDRVIKEGLVENRILNAIHKNSIFSLQDLVAKINVEQKEFDAGVGELRRLKVIRVKEEKIFLLSSSTTPLNNELETTLKMIKNNPQAEVNEKILQILLRRQLIRRSKFTKT
ncbi:MAG: bis-aminopropyl spermidine synthase family protein [Candidatus Hermodarchaeota archaeon]